MSKEERRRIDFPAADPHTPDRSTKSSDDAKDASSSGGGNNGKRSLSPADFGPGGKGWADALGKESPPKRKSPKPPGPPDMSNGAGSDGGHGDSNGGSNSLSASLGGGGGGSTAAERKKGEEAAIFGDGDDAEKLFYSLVNRSVVLNHCRDRSNRICSLASSNSSVWLRILARVCGLSPPISERLAPARLS